MKKMPTQMEAGIEVKADGYYPSGYGEQNQGSKIGDVNDTVALFI